MTDPGEAPVGHADDAAYQAQLKARVNEYRSNSRACVAEFKRLRDEGTAQEGNLAVKWSAEGVKWARLAEEMQDKIDGREHDLRLIRHEEAMSRVRDAH